MQLHIRTSSTEIISINDFKYIYELAKCSKCQMFTLLQSTNKLYGASDDCCCIHEIDVPFFVNTDLMFRLDTVDPDLLDKYTNFFVPDKFNWVILPDYYWNMYIGGDLVSEYVYEVNQYLILDKTTRKPIEQIHMFKYRACNDYGRMTFMKQLEGFINRIPRLSNRVETFYGIHEDSEIRKACDNKVSIGRVLCRMKNENIDVAFYFYKGLFTLGKSDTLDLDIRFDLYETKNFMATFKPKKKKNPLKFNPYGVPFQERIHCMFFNLI